MVKIFKWLYHDIKRVLSNNVGGLITKSYTWSAGATIIAAEHNTNLDTIFNELNGNLDNANLKASAAIVDTKLAQITSNDKVHASALVATTETSGDMLYLNSAGSWVRSPSAVSGTINYIFDGAGAAVATGIGAGFIVVDFPCTIVRSVLLTDRLSNTTVDVRKDTYANFPPKGGDTITGSSKLILTNASAYMDNTLSGWTTSIAAGDILRFVLHANNSAQAIVAVLKIRRP